MTEPVAISRTLGERLDELLADYKASAETRSFVMLAAATGGDSEEPPDPNDLELAWDFETADNNKAKPVWLDVLSVCGFRGIGPEAKLSLTPGPGLTVVMGRNGSGKSSFAEAIEVALTGKNSRWVDKAGKAWSDGWKNLHCSTDPSISARFLVEKAPAVNVAVSWSGERFDSLSTAATSGESSVAWDDLKWDEPLDLYRPFLPYSELSAALDKSPSALYDTFSKMLGLDDVVAIKAQLRTWRLAAEQPRKNMKGHTESMRATLEASEDDRALAALTLLESRDADLDQIGRLAAGEDGVDVQPFRSIAGIEPPDAEACERASESLAAALVDLEALAGTDVGASSRIASLLEAALELHNQVGHGDCPVCGTGSLDDAWAEQASEDIHKLRKAAASYTEAENHVGNARRECNRLIKRVPQALVDAVDLDGVDEVRTLWTAWADTTDSEFDDEQLIQRLQGATAVVEGVNLLRNRATAELERLSDRWRPVAVELGSWLEAAHVAEIASAKVKPLKAAEDFMKSAEDTMRHERYEPIRERATQLWGELRQSSNVSLEDIALSGSSTSRKVEIKVTVDGTGTSALGVMSQGELNALSLALFLPRATSDQSPFRFVVIDDPVQAMDPSKVEGLAKVLHSTGKDRQVVVFTHDERLPAACRRLELEHTLIQVDRRLNSEVEARTVLDPVQQLLDDVETIAKGDGIPAELLPKIIPVHCRQAVEVCARELAWPRLLAEGRSHLEIEVELDRARQTTDVLGVLMFGAAGDPRDVYDKLEAIDPNFKAHKQLKYINHAVHDPQDDMNMIGLVIGARRIVSLLRENWG